MKSYKFREKDAVVFEIFVGGEYRDGTKDIDVVIGSTGVCGYFNQIACCDIDDIFKWLDSQNISYDSKRSKLFDYKYIMSVVLDENATEEEIVKEVAAWTDDEIDSWHELHFE